MTELDQICLWVAGQSIHDDEHSLCVPDYSCCYPALLAPHETREAFLAAYMTQSDLNTKRGRAAELTVRRMHVRFLRQLIQLREAALRQEGLQNPSPRQEDTR